MDKISVLLLNYNGADLLEDCLKSLNNQTVKDFELIIVDNSSKDNSVTLIERFKKQSSLKIKTCYLKENVGFSQGNIEGLRYAKGDYIALLNNDTEANENWLKEMVRAMDTYPEVGICASKMIVYGTNIIDSAGHIFTSILKGCNRGEGETDKNYNTHEYVFGACGGAVLYRKKMIDEIGFLDEDFFLIHEDVDLNFRAQLYGWKVLYVPTAVVQHKVRSSIGYMSDVAVYYTLKNSEFVRIKNIPFGIFITHLPQFVIGIFMEFLYFAIKHKRLKLYFKAKFDVVNKLPKMLRKRAIIMKNKKVSNDYLNSIIMPISQKNFLKSKLKKLLYG